MMDNNLVKTLVAVFCSLEEKLEQLARPGDAPEVFAIVRTINFSTDIQNTVVIPRNADRQGFIIANRSADDVFLSFDQNTASDSFFSIPVATNDTVYYIPNRNPYKGDVRIYVNDTTGFCTITELSY